MYSDMSRVREKTGYQLWEKTSAVTESFVASSRMQYVELLFNGSYHGVYGLTEPLDGRQLGLSDGDLLYKIRQWPWEFDYLSLYSQRTGETEIENGVARYRFSRSEHRECRAFVKQESGVISAREGISANAVYRRKMVLRGLKDATVYLFPEKGCEQICAVSDGSIGLDRTPVFLDGFELVRDKKHGTYLKGEHITGDIFFLMGKKKHS
jgi:hypothetical protein